MLVNGRFYAFYGRRLDFRLPIFGKLHHGFTPKNSLFPDSWLSLNVFLNYLVETKVLVLFVVACVLCYSLPMTDKIFALQRAKCVLFDANWFSLPSAHTAKTIDGEWKRLSFWPLNHLCHTLPPCDLIVASLLWNSCLQKYGTIAIVRYKPLHVRQRSLY